MICKLINHEKHELHEMGSDAACSLIFFLSCLLVPFVVKKRLFDEKH